ncbi:MAG: Holliday junction branch migration protein RuvA, partial [Myxococcota bacterium]
MIAYLRGEVRNVTPGSMVLDVRGVGYLVHLPPNMQDSFQRDQTISLHIATIVREDAITLYGFGDTSQRELFDLLRGVKGVGPRLALAILGHLAPGQLVTAITQEDLTTLVAVPGVGRKTAGRLCLELKNKIPAHFTVADGVGASAPKPSDQLPLALAQLGYRKSEIDLVL